jgi:hypothetical protein
LGTTSDERGNFIIPHIPANNRYTLIFTYIGYRTEIIKVYVEKNRITHFEIGLTPEGIELGTVEKIADKINPESSVDVSLQRINIKELESLPRGVEMDILRTLQFMPGVRSTGDITAKYYVRGSASFQNLVLINKTTIYNPFHALGMFSIIDPDIINNLDFYKGGFTSEYGGRVSSVLNLITKDGNRNKYSVSATSSLLTGKLLAEGPIPNGSFIVAGRKSYSNQILKKFLNYQSAPFDFYDLSFKLNYSNPNFLPDAKFTIHAFLSGDNIDYKNPLRENYKWRNNLVGFNWFNIYAGTPLYSELGISLSEFEGEIEPNYSKARRRYNKLQDISFFFDVTYVFNSRDELSVGTRIEQISSTLINENANGSESSLNDQGLNFITFIKYKLLRINNLGIDIGTRLNATGLAKSKKDILEPRATITYKLIPEVTLKAAWGIYQQDVISLSSENDIISLFEPWIILPNYIDAARSIHYIGGINTKLGNFSFDFEAYYKLVLNQPVLNDAKYFPSDPDLIAGKQEAFGYEALLRYMDKPLNLSISYSLSWAYQEVNKWLYYPRYDARHSLNIITEYDFGSDWIVSAIWIYNSGLPFSQNMGFYQKMNFDNLWDSQDALELFHPQSILFGKNLGRLPNYHRLDLSLSKKFNIHTVSFILDLSVINVYDRRNIFYFERETGERINMLPILPTATLKIKI